MLYSSTSHSIFTLCLSASLSRASSIHRLLLALLFRDSILQSVITRCCSVLQCVAVCCSVLQCVAAYDRLLPLLFRVSILPLLFRVSICLSSHSLSSHCQSKCVSIFSPSIRLSACMPLLLTQPTHISRQQGAIS